MKLSRMVERFTSNDAFEENIYVLYDRAAKECIIIDPGAGASEVIAFVEGEGCKVQSILATHAHIDHVVSAPALVERFRSPFLVPKADLPLLDGIKEQADAFGYHFKGDVRADGSFEGGASFELGAHRIDVLHTPGHTPGSSCFFLDRNMLFTGDTLFAGSIGRTDLPRGSPKDMVASLKKLAALPGLVVIYPGHDEESTIGEEKATNPYLRFTP
ncbi:MAG: MBL fold metallo-hydrolase [Conexivisphaerales archaeon]